MFKRSSSKKETKQLDSKSKRFKKRKILTIGILALFLILLLIGTVSGFVFLRHKQLCTYSQVVDSGLISSESNTNLCPNILDGEQLGTILSNAFNFTLVSGFKLSANANIEGAGGTNEESCNSETDIVCYFKQMGGELKQTDGFTTMLLAVSDNRNHNGDLAGNTDSIMVMSLDNRTGKVLLISFPRDIYTTYTNTWGSTVSSKINSIYAFYGREKFVEVIEKLIGKPIHYSAILSFDVFDQLINQLGGVDITLEEPFEDLYPCSEVPANSGYSCYGAFGWFNFPAGPNHFNSFQAQVYSRSRYASSDYSRAKRQQNIVKAIMSNALSKPMPIGEKFNLYKTLYETFSSKVESNIEMKDLASMLSLFEKLSDDAATIVVDPLLDNYKIIYEYGISEVGWVTKFHDYSYKQLNNYIANIWNNLTFYTETPKILVMNASGAAIPAELSAITTNPYVTSSEVASDMEVKGIRIYDFSKGGKPGTIQEILEKVPGALIYSPAIDEIVQSEFGEDIVILLGAPN